MFDVPKESYEFIYSLRERYVQYVEIFNEIELNLNNKLWNQLSESLIVLSEKPEIQESNDLIELYNRLVFFIEKSFNPMKLMILISNVIKNFSSNKAIIVDKLFEALYFLENIEQRLETKGEELIYLKSLKGFCYLHMGKLYECEDTIKEVKHSLEKMFEVDPLVYSNLYLLSLEYYEKKQNWDEFYNNAIQYFAYVKEHQISKEKKLILCYKMAIASLIGEKMFNFAELMEKDFFKLLLGSQFEFIYYLILCFNSAKVDQFIDMMENHRASIKNDPILSNKIDFLHTKVRVAALLDLIFQKNKNERVITYREIHQKCLCDMDKIEFLVIKALSLELIKGYIDEVENKVVVNWVQPKFLDREKISVLYDRIDSWIKKANENLINFQETSHPLLV